MEKEKYELGCLKNCCYTSFSYSKTRKNNKRSSLFCRRLISHYYLKLDLIKFNSLQFMFVCFNSFCCCSSVLQKFELREVGNCYVYVVAF